MITKEHEIKKYCLFYASDFHLEMILLPYIKNNIDDTHFTIFTEKNLDESLKILLSKTNLKFNEKEQMLKLGWNIKKDEKITSDELNNNTIIINGSKNYISNINKKISMSKAKKVNIIDCYNIEEKDIDVERIKKQYDDILNTKKYKKFNKGIDKN